MNGVRRLLGAATGQPPISQPDSLTAPPQTPPLALSSKQPGPSWPPPSPTAYQTPMSPGESPKTTAALFLRKDRSSKPPPPLPPEENGKASPPAQRMSSASSVLSPARSQKSYTTSSPAHSPTASISQSSLPRVQPLPRVVTRKSVTQSEPERNHSSGSLNPNNTRDELLISLLASEAVVDSREFPILSSEEVEDLKKEQQVLTSRLGAMTKKLGLETKIRDAAVSLAKVNASHKKISKQTDEQLDAANRRVDAAQKELWRVSERSNEVSKKLLEHRAGVLSYSVRSMEKKMAPDADDSGYDTSNRSTLMSPTTSSMTGMSSSSSKARFDGAHLFAGHVDALVPKRVLTPEAAATEIASLEEKLKAATESLTAAGKKQAEMARELTLMRLEKQEVETMMGMDLQSAEETINALEKELPRLEGLDAEVQTLLHEKEEWERERRVLQERGERLEALQDSMAALEARKGEAAGAEKVMAEARERSQRELAEKEAELQALKGLVDALKEEWEAEKADMEDEKMDDLARLQEEMDKLREQDKAALQKANEELDSGLGALRTLVTQHGIVLFSRDSSLQGLLESVGTHLDGVHQKLESYMKMQAEWDSTKRKLENDVRAGLDKRESLVREVEEARRERDSIIRDSRSIKGQSETHSIRSPLSNSSALPEYTGDAGKLVSVLKPIWDILPSPEARAAKFASQRNFRPGSPSRERSGTNPTSLSELDVRSLKSLYDGKLSPGMSMSPKYTPFTVEAFASRVQALIADDRSLIERLVRFAQAHDLLKKNAERAQKLAQETNAALETYQKQVRTLEERNMNLSMKQAALQEEVQTLQDAVDRITIEKQEVEMHAAEQAETCRQLTEANNTLSAKTLTLAQEAASAPEAVRKQLESQLTECKKALEAARGEVDAMRMSEQSQSMALMEELNTMQTENGMLRAQLRAVKK